MATAPQATMEMPQQGANPFDDPNTMAVYDQMRQTVSPKEFGDELLTSASQSSPEEVAAFRSALEQIDMPPQVLDALNDVVDEILASPERYDELRAKYMGQGLPEEILPEQFDPQFFVALNMAIDQMIAAPAGVQAFAKGGIAELKPIAKAIASYGRNGDTMLAHITPAEARMLRRRGGSGTINPDTGLPEFFLKKLWKTVTAPLRAVAKAVQSFAKSTVGKIVLTVALGFFLGPAAATFLGVSSAAGVAAVSGFIGGAGSTLLAGGNLKAALKAGAIGGLTAGAGAGVMGGSGAFASGSYTGPTTIGGQFDSFKGMLPGGTSATAAPTAPPTPIDTGLSATGAAPVPSSAIAGPTAPNAQFGVGDPGAGFEPVYAPVKEPYSQLLAETPARGSNLPENALTDNITTGTQREAYIKSMGLDKPQSTLDQVKDLYSKNISPSGIKEAGIPAAQDAGAKAVSDLRARDAAATAAMRETAYQTAYKAALPGMLSTYGPMAGLGLGALSAFGGFESKPVQSGPITQSLMKPVTQRIAEDGTQRQMYMQGLPGVKYDEYGAPIFGQSTPLPAYGVPDYNSGGYGQPQQGMNLPPVYVPPPGTIGSRSVAQPYNNSDMYPNLAPRRRMNMGGIAGLAQGGYPRKTGQISGPGTEKSDSIPAMLSDGEFVMTASAVRGAGKGSRRAGAKKMYTLMHQLEKNSERG